MNGLIFSRKETEKGVILNCVTNSHYLPITQGNSIISYEYSAKKVIDELAETLDEKILGKEKFYLEKLPLTEFPTKNELIQIKNALDKYLQEKKLNIQLEIAV